MKLRHWFPALTWLAALVLYVLTRDTPEAVFYVLNAEEHLCPDYSDC